jgi:hypothetical protein
LARTVFKVISVSSIVSIVEVSMGGMSGTRQTLFLPEVLTIAYV